jgi:hypothetical protein
MTAVQLANLRVKRPPVTQEIWVGTHSGGEILVGYWRNKDEGAGPERPGTAAQL